MIEGIKWLHVVCALLSGGGFFIRGILMIRESAWLQMRMVRIAPHVVDTLLLLSAIALASQWGWAALQLPWLLAKIVALLVYIGLGVMALRAGLSKRVRVWAWLAALLVFAYIITVAVSKTPLVFF